MLLDIIILDIRDDDLCRVIVDALSQLVADFACRFNTRGSGDPNGFSLDEENRDERKSVHHDRG